MAARFRTLDADARIDEAIAYFAERAQPFDWWIGPTTRPEDLGRRLEVHGLRYTHDLPGMAADLDALPDRPPAPASVTIGRVEDVSGLRLFVDVVGTVFRMSDAVRQGFFEWNRQLGFASEPPWIRYLAMLDEMPVGAAAFLLAAGVVGVYAVATLRDARGRGIGSLVTWTGLVEGRERGYRMGILHSSEMALGVYRGLGFEVFCPISLYRWPGSG